jgi:hypothetical protein
MSRFRLVESLPMFAYKRACAITGAKAEAGERYLDLDFSIENDSPNGHLYARESVVRVWAEMIGYLPPSDVVDLEAEVLSLKVRNAELEDRLTAFAEMQGILDEAGRLIAERKSEEAKQKVTTK